LQFSLNGFIEHEHFNRMELMASLLEFPRRVLEGLRMYHQPLGIRGAMAFSSYRLFGRPVQFTVTPPGIRNPVHLRMRTTDVSIYNEVLLGGQYAFDLPFSPKTIVDAGANIGMASIYFANKYPAAKIVAVEPEASNFSVLVQNVERYPNILPMQAALWNRDGEIALSAASPSESPFSMVGFVAHEGEGVPVRAVTLPTLMKETQLTSIDVLKVDIEGAEKEVFESSDWMDRVRCLLIELHDRFKPGASQAVNSVTGDFLSSQSGETTIYIRKSSLVPSAN
jgi:FkbM family methyltransferase